MEIHDVKLFGQVAGSPEESRKYALAESFVSGGYRYWTNGRMAVRAPSEDSDTKDFGIPAVLELMWSAPEGMQPIEWKREPDEVYYQQHWFGESENEFGYKQSSCRIGDILLDAHYFKIANSLSPKTYYFRPDEDGFQLLIICEKCEVVLMSLRTNQEIEGCYRITPVNK